MIAGFIRWFRVGVSVVFWFCFLFSYSYSFNLELEQNQQYMFLTFAYIMLAIYIVLIMAHAKKISIRDLFLLILIAFLSLLSLKLPAYSTANEGYSMLICFLILYVLLPRDIKEIRLFLWALVSMFLLEFLVISFQYISGRTYLQLTGSLHNSGIAAVVMVLHLPFVYYLTHSQKSRDLTMISEKRRNVIERNCPALKEGIFGLSVVLCIAFSILVASRTSWIILVFFALIYVVFRLKSSFNYKTKSMILVVIAILMSISMYLLYGVKESSSEGRRLILNVSLRHIPEHCWTGIGIGRFPFYYPQWQADYFKGAGDIPTVFRGVAGESYVAFNEYAELFLSVGIFGFTACFLLVVKFFKGRSVLGIHCLKTAKLTVFAILIASLFTYALHVNVIILMALVSLRIAESTTATPQAHVDQPYVDSGLKSVGVSEKIGIWKKVLVPVLMLLLILQISVFKFQELIAVKTWVNIRNNTNYSNRQKLDQYNALYPRLKYNGKFLSDYGLTLLKTGRFEKRGIEIMLTGHLYFISRRTLEQIGDAFEYIGDFNNAINYYERESYFIPGIYYPKFKLMNLYHKTGQKKKCVEMCRNIISMPVKITSPLIPAYKKNAMIILKTINNPNSLDQTK